MNSALIAKINDYITDNGNGLITGPVLNTVLRDMVNQSVAIVPYVSLMTMVGNKQVVPGMLYKIADRGDRGIFLVGLTGGTLSREGFRVMLCPATYLEETLDGNEWKGVWRNSKTAAVDDLFIWGGHVWKNKTGVIGTQLSQTELDTTNWEQIPKNSFLSGEYIEKSFNVSFDFDNDWIEQQTNGQKVIVGISFATKNMFGLTVNPADVTDWNVEANCRIFRNSSAAFGIFNNIFHPLGGISEVVSGIITDNDVGAIENVVCNPISWGADSDVFAAIDQNECLLIKDVYRSGGISKIPSSVDGYCYHTDDESFYFQWNFGDGEEDDGPIESGNSALRNCILALNTALIEMNVMGVGLSGTGSPQIKVGLDVDDESYIGFTALTTLNSGVRNTTFGNKTTADFRQFKISVTGGDVTAGILRVSGKYI